MIKKLTLPLFLLCLPAAAYAADKPLTLSGGSGTAEDPYLMSTKADFIELATACNTPEGTATNGNTASHYSGVHFLMTADIDFTGDTDFKGIAVAPIQYSSATSWKFQGVFDGGGHTVSGLELEGIVFDTEGKAQSGGANRSRNNVGLFGCLEGATVRNLNIAADCRFSGYDYVGSIAGYLEKGSVIENCTSLAAVDCYDSYGGGIAGRVNATTSMPTQITGCMFGGTVRVCNNNVGGITGYSGNANVTISGCVNTGAVIASSFNAIKADGIQYTAGGIAGGFTGKMTDCFNAGPVTATQKNAGGLVGNYTGTSSTITSCISLGSVTCPDLVTRGILAGAASGKFVDCAFDAQMWGEYPAAHKTFEGATGMTTAALTAGTAIEGYSAEKWTFESGFYPRPAGRDNEIIRRAAATYLLFPEGQSALDFKTSAKISTAMAGITATVTEGADHFSVEGTTLSATNLENIEQGVVTLANGNFKLPVALVAVPTFFTGTGTAEDPYIIDSKKALMGLAQLCNGVQMKHFAGEYFKQTADIDLTGETGFIGIGVTPQYASAANMLHFFSGTYDGGGHTISGVSIDGTVADETGKIQSMKSYASAGLFGAARLGAVIKGVNLDATCSITGYNNVGGIVGECGEDVTISDCSSAANITAYGRYAGGIVAHITVGSNNYLLDNVAISRCGYYGTLRSADSYVGGIAGYNAAVITDCVNGGAISIEKLSEFITPASSAYAGGIAGYSAGKILRGMNIGTVTADNRYVGGITGQNTTAQKRGDLTGCINAGQIVSAATSDVGAIVGNENVSSSYSPKLDNNWFDQQYSGFQASGSSKVYISAAPATTAELTAGTALEGTEGLSLAAGRYPLPEPLAASEPALRAVSTFMNLLEGESLVNFTQGTLATAMPLTAEVLDGAATFSVADGKVTAAPVQEITPGAVSIACSGYNRRLALKTLPGILPGNGTMTTPYLVASEADLTTLANAINDSGFDYAGRYFEQTADIDFTDCTLVPVGNLTTAFNGIYDGKGHSVSNIKNPAPADVMQRDRAIFGNVGTQGIIRDVHLKTSDIRGNLNTGGIVAILSGRVENCSVGEGCIIYSIPSTIDTSNPPVHNGTFAGGIAARVTAGAVITGCVNHGKVLADNSAAGITGGNTAGESALIENCQNYGEIGGVMDPLELFSGYAMTGGIAGRLSGTIRNCSHHGRAVATQVNDAGGILGYAYGGTLVEDCVNEGSVEVNWLYGGGIIGCTDASVTADKPVTVKRCANHGVVNVSAMSGGIIGLAKANTVITDCWNTHDIANREGASAGGIVGESEGAVTVTGCWNKGAINANRGAAGIVGEAMTDGLEVTRCFNTGEISVTTATETVKPEGAAGIANSYYQTPFTVTSCYNVGAVKGYDYVGGISGKAYGATITDCYNTGAVTSDRTAGNIIGFNTGSTVTNCYVADTCPELAPDNTEGVTRVSEAALMTAELGDSYVYAAACLPRLTGLELVPEAVINSARYLLSDGDTPDNVASVVKLAEIDGLVWTAEGPVELKGSDAVPTDLGEFTLTATFDELTRAYKFTSTYDPVAAGIGDIAADGTEIIGWTDLSGRTIGRPAPGTVAIALLRKPSGQTAAIKVLVK